MREMASALQDIRQSLSQYQIWLNLGFLEVKQRYRRSVLGPWWITLTMSIFILAMGTIFSRLFKQNLSEYIPFFTVGFLMWSFISTCISEATEILKSNNGFIKQVKLPYNIYLLKFFTKNLIILAHNLVVYFLVIAYFKINPGWNFLFAIPGMLLLTINLYWICLLVTLVSTRFRDMIPIITTCLQILFFVTPISWTPKLLGENSILIKLNPFVYLLDIVRQPLLGNIPTPMTWMITSLMACLGLAITLKIFSRSRTRIPFWID
jgi:ABC-2 type transport system permease protein/lipopolysaccharide transport system permease protein